MVLLLHGFSQRIPGEKVSVIHGLLFVVSDEVGGVSKRRLVVHIVLGVENRLRAGGGVSKLSVFRVW